MRGDDIPEEVLRFIERRIDSVPHIETLLLLWEDPARSWTGAEIAARVYVSGEQGHRVLLDLARNGLIAAVTPTSFAYRPDWDEGQLMKKVAAAYRGYLVQISQLIHAKAASEAVRDFARAFQFKSEE